MDISVKELKKMFSYKKINLIDIRKKEKYVLGTIGNAINISENELLYHMNKYLKKDEEYVVFCQTGSSSKVVCEVLNSFGYKVYNLIGGYSKYVLD